PADILDRWGCRPETALCRAEGFRDFDLLKTDCAVGDVAGLEHEGDPAPSRETAGLLPEFQTILNAVDRLAPGSRIPVVLIGQPGNRRRRNARHRSQLN